MMTVSRNPNGVLFELDLLRALLAVADAGSFTAAAGRLHATQSTVSQKIQRLEALAGQRLLDRSGREVLATEAGTAMLGYARRMLALNQTLAEVLAGQQASTVIRIGLPEDFAGGPTTALLAAFSRQYRQVRLEVTSGLSRQLADSYDQGELDLVLIKQRQGRRSGVACWPEPMAWVDALSLPAFACDPLPLVAFPPGGLYRQEMIDAVQGLGRRWHVGFTSSSLGGMQTAVAAGLGISLLPRRALLPGHAVLGPGSGLASVQGIERVMLHRASADPLVKVLAAQWCRLLDEEQAGAAVAG